MTSYLLSFQNEEKTQQQTCSQSRKFFFKSRVATVREKYLENKIFPSQGKVREFCGWPGKCRKNLESQGKVREFENKWLWQAVSRKFLYPDQEVKGCTLSRDSLSLSGSLHW